MIVNSTEVKNNFGKYLRLVQKEDVIITSNGNKIARLTVYNENYKKEDDGWIIREGSVAFEMPPRKVTYEEFLEISEESEQRLEYIDGEIYLLASPNIDHQMILGEMYTAFREWFHGNKCKVMLAPFEIKLQRSNGGRNVVQPDLMVICDLEEKRNEKGKYDGVPALVVEILSEGTRKKDLIRKLDLYMSCGVKEYWIVDPMSREVEVFHFNDGDILNKRSFKGKEKADSFIYSGFSIPVERIFQ